MTGSFRIKLVSASLVAVLSAGPVWSQSVSYRHDMTIYGDTSGKNLVNPAGVACKGSRLVIADTRNSRLLIYDNDSGVDGVTRETRLLRQTLPAVVQIGPNGELFAYDQKTKEVLRFDAAGNRDGRVTPVDIPGKSRVVTKSFRVDSSGNIYLLDVFGRRVVVLDPTGTFTRQVPFPREFGFISDLAVDSSGRIFILDSVRPRVFTAAPEEEDFVPHSENLGGVLSFPTHLEADSQGRVYVVDEETSSVGVLRRDGSYSGKLFNRGRKEGLLYYPSQLCVEDGSRIVIADRDNSRVQVFVERE